MIPIIVTFIDLFSLVFTILLLGRVVLSWIYPHPGSNAITTWLYELTEPVLVPIRKLMPQTGMIDLAPLAAFFLLQALVWAAHYLLLHLG
ncbi:MAG TPA: YggT family protein [Candidatus Saccharimonadales bacterium]|nr:YggT family protein [Candidatus Saccharimonadales bacterium]